VKDNNLQEVKQKALEEYFSDLQSWKWHKRKYMLVSALSNPIYVLACF
jgi:hypothetical protein